MLGNFHDAEDLSQEVFLTVFRKLDSFKTGFKFKNWLLKITHNKCINFLKANKMTSITLDDGLKEKLSREEKSSLIDHERVMQLVREAVAELDPQSRSIFTLFHFKGLPYGAISEITEKSTGNLKVIVHRARKSIYKTVRRRQRSGEEV
jgi:RNA polymerase sigma-70 factor (ECF subfamily)